jgi:competence protein ComEA
VDLNRAGLDELAGLPGVGRALAARIVAAREAAGRFTSADDLRRVRGLGRAKIERLRPLVGSAE